MEASAPAVGVFDDLPDSRGALASPRTLPLPSDGKCQPLSDRNRMVGEPLVEAAL